jgi:hypothetical protein
LPCLAHHLLALQSTFLLILQKSSVETSCKGRI